MFAQALGRAVMRGVRVRVLVDAVGARYSSPTIVQRLRREGVHGGRCLRRGRPKTEHGPIEARLVHGGPDRSDEPIRWLKLASGVRATRRVLIVTPYFVPDEDVVSALRAAASAGVQIRIVLPSVNNLRLIAWASRACWPRRLERGIEIILSPPPFEQTKLMLIDSDTAIVGSANGDERSFRLNFEADLVCHGSAWVEALDEAVALCMLRAHEVTLGELATCSMPSRLRDHAARLALHYL